MMTKPLARTLFAATLLAACAATPFLVAHAAQPHMEAALKSLQEARAQLAAATHDKGGHRVEAMKAIDRAIAEVKRGIEFDRTHVSPGENRR